MAARVRIPMTPDKSVEWLLSTCRWGRLYFDPEAEPAITNLVKRCVDRGPGSIPEAQLLDDASKGGVVWRVGDVALRHVHAYTRPDSLETVQANVTLTTGLERTSAQAWGRAVRGLPYYALAVPNDSSMGDFIATGFVEGKRFSSSYDAVPGDGALRDLYPGAMRACGGNGDYYYYDDYARNLINGPDKTIYKLDIETI